jgi:DNA-binding GntR family transcriptional regulator
MIVNIVNNQLLTMSGEVLKLAEIEAIPVFRSFFMASTVLYRTLTQQIADQIRAEVLSGHLPVGTPLREKALADRFGVSRGPIRDSLLQLTHEGLLISKPNCGVMVGRTLCERIQPLVVKLRRQVETHALEMLLEDGIDVLPELTRTCEQLRTACETADMSAVVQHDMAFHRCIVESHGDDEMVAIWLPIVVRMMLHYTRHKELMDSYHEHMAIVDAIRKGQAKQAIRALEKNIQ